MNRILRRLFGTSIRDRFIASVAVFYMVMMTAFVLDVVRRQRNFFSQNMSSRMFVQVNMLAAASREPLEDGRTNDIQDITNSVSSDRYLRYTAVTDPGGHILASTGRSTPTQRMLPPPDAAAATEDPAGARIVSTEGTILTAACPIVKEGRLLGWAWLSRDFQNVQENIASVTRTGLIYTLAAILIGTALAALLANTVTRPLRMLVEGARRAVSDVDHQPIPVTTENEVGEFTAVFNESIAKLRARTLELARANEDLATVVGTIPVGVAVARKSQPHLVTVNRVFASLLELSNEADSAAATAEESDDDVVQIKWPPVQFITAEEAGDKSEDPIAACLRTGLQVRNWQARVELAGARQVELSADVVPLLDERHQVRGCVASFVNVTSLRETEEVLKRANELLVSARDRAIESSEAKTAFLAAVSHELRTPLSAIIGYAELLEEEVAGQTNSTLPEDVARIREAADHLLGVVNSILDLSKIEAGRMDVAIDDFDVEPLLRRIADSVERLVAARSNVLELEVPPGLGRMQTDQGKLRQILYNLLSNAAKFTTKGRIVLSAARGSGGGGDEVVLKVMDTGIGIARHDLPRLFRDFTQLDSRLTRQYGGTGLGLAISDRFCRMLGGKISVDSEPGKGSTFTVVLPASLKHEGGAALVTAGFDEEDAGRF